MVQFHGEGGLDYGGLAREWFYLLSVEVFDPRLGMFEYCNQEDYALQINPVSATDQDHLLYFQFVGRLLGMAVRHQHFLDVTFIASFYKRLLGQPLSLADLQDVDPDMHRSMIWILENDVTEVRVREDDGGRGGREGVVVVFFCITATLIACASWKVIDMDFTVDYDHFGETRSHELKPGGSKIEVSGRPAEARACRPCRCPYVGLTPTRGSCR